MSALISASARRIALRTLSTARPLPACSDPVSFHVARSFSRTAPAHYNDRIPPSPLGPIGVEAALRAASDPSFKPRQTLFKEEFSIAGRVAVVTGAQRGLGLEMAATLAEAGAAVYCLDLPVKPDSAFGATKDYISKIGMNDRARLEYGSVDVTNQQAIWDTVEKIANKEGRMDVAVAAAGIISSQHCLDITADELQKIMNVNVNGVLFTAQAAGRQMAKFGTPGSIVMIASMAASVGSAHGDWTAYAASKSAVKQMARNMACELGPKNIRVNTISPGYVHTNMTKQYLETSPEIIERWSAENPLGRIARPDELRGLVAWLASDASSFCTGSDILITGGHHAW